MFPDPCGAIFAEAAKNGADPTTIVPDDYFVVFGGIAPLPTVGGEFSCSVGPSLEAAAAAIPNGQLRWTTARAIRAGGGRLEWVAEESRHHTINRQHVNITEGGASSSFSELMTNPVPRRARIDGDKK